MNKNNNKVKRGAILRCTSGKHQGDYYLLVRTMSGMDKCEDFLGNNLTSYPGKKYSYNLVNLGTGEARQTEVERQFISSLDGVDYPLRLRSIENHFGMTFEDVTDVASIRVEVKDILDEKLEEKRDQETVMQVLDMGKVLMSMMPTSGGAKVVPLFGPDGVSVLAYVVQA